MFIAIGVLSVLPSIERQGSCEQQQSAAAGAIEPERTGGAKETDSLGASGGVSKHDDEVDGRESNCQRRVLRKWRLRRNYELGQERGKEQIALGIGHGNQEAAEEYRSSGWTTDGTLIIVKSERSIGPEQPNAQVGQVEFPRFC